MTRAKETDKTLIESKNFDICLVDGLTRAQISKKYKRTEVTTHKSVFYLEKFLHHIKTIHNLSIVEYCEKYLNIDWPLAISEDIKVGYKIDGRGLSLSRYSKGTMTKANCSKFVASCEKISKERMGENNPMFGVPAWNAGMTLKNSDGNEVAKNWFKTIKSEAVQTKRMATLVKNGNFQTKPSSLQVKMREFLSTLNLIERPQEEFPVRYYSMDFAFPNNKVALECQGQYYHCDPRIYPNGPINEMQTRNVAKDKERFAYFKSKGWRIIESWEAEIKDGTFKGIVLKKLKELGIINESPINNIA